MPQSAETERPAPADQGAGSGAPARRRAPGGALLAALLALPGLAGAQQPMHPGPMHDGWGWMLLPGLFWLILIGGAIAAVILMIRARGGAGSAASRPSARPSARDVLDERYARGEIDREEYLTRRDDLAPRSGDDRGAGGRPG
jgi:putative membrane protein